MALTMARNHRIALLLALMLTVLAGTAQAQTRYRNIVNNRFATVSNGPQSSLIVDAKPGDSADAIRQSVQRGVRAEWTARRSGFVRQVAALRHAGIIKGRGVVPISTLVHVRQNGRLVLPTRTTRAVGGGTITFRYTGFSASDQKLLSDTVALAYPLIVQLYGQPAVSGEVEVVNLGTFDTNTGTEVQRLAFGAYDVSNNRILLPLFDSAESTLQAFLLNIIHAFHGPAVFAYDAWEQGFARAAAAVISRNPAFGFTDPSANHFYSWLPYYELLNQPALGNSTFFPPSQANLSLQAQFTIGKMLLPRIGMSGAAWLKVYIENQDFFRQFNAQYYAQLTPAVCPSLAGVIPTLKTIAASIVPNVEGLAFADWYARQYILDTSVALGTKLYAFVVPGQFDSTKPDGGQSASIVLVYYRTKIDGDEELLNGQAYATYIDSSNTTVNLGPGSETAPITDGETGSNNSVGFTTLAFPTPGFDSGRITMDFHVGKDVARTYIPSGFDGDFQAVVLGQQSGQAVVNESTIPSVTQRSKNADMARGAFATTLGTPITDLGKVTVTLTVNGVATNYIMNVGDGQYYAVIRAQGNVTTVQKDFRTGTIPYILSLPVTPLATATDAALGVSATDFLLSYWDGQRSTYETYATGQNSVSPLKAGRGYWLKLTPLSGAADQVLRVTGVAPAQDTDVLVNVPFGWSLVGYPFEQATSINNVRVQYLQRDPVSWQDAVNSNLVAALPYRFDRSQGYQTTDTIHGENWEGVWVRALVPAGVTLLFPGPQSPTKAFLSGNSRAATAPARPTWSIQLRARTETGVTATATFGTAPDATRAFDNRWDREAPPPILPTPTITFPHTDWANMAGRYVADFRSLGGANQNETWQMHVATPQAGRVLLSWAGLGDVPRNTRLTLVDKATGTQTPLRSRTSYVFTAPAGDTGRDFEIVAEPGRSRAFALTNLTTTTTRAVGTAFSYTLTDQATVRLEITTLSGRVVSQPQAGRAQTAGTQTVHWNGRAQGNTPLPVGPYLVRVTAQAEDGTQAVQQRVFMILR